MRAVRNFMFQLRKAREAETDNLNVLQLTVRLLHWLLLGDRKLMSFIYLNLHKKGSGFKNILTSREFNKIHNKLNPKYYRVLLEDKFVFDRFLKSFDYPLAEMIGLIKNNTLIWLIDQRSEPIENIVNYNLNCYLKMHTSWGGKEVHKLDILDKRLNVDNTPGNIETLKKIISQGLFVLQNTIKQHHLLNTLNSSCVNTIRMITIHNGYFSSNFRNFIRMGTGSSVVDNITQGGVGCGIHNNGILFDHAFDNRGKYIHIDRHPTTNTKFQGFSIPYFQDALKLVTRMHDSFHYFFVISWDIAITESGPVVIEGNPLGDLVHEQFMFGGLRKEFLEYADSYMKKSL